jgi:uncharacterized RDD family membrane protein YckC
VTDHRCPRCGAQLAAIADRCPDCGADAPRRSAALDATDPAPVRRRLMAVLTDTAPLILLLGGFLVTVVASHLTRGVWMVLAGAAVAWCLLLWGWSSANGQSPGKAILGLRVVDERTGGRVGSLRALLRLVARAVATIGTLGAAALSYRWDPIGREQTWWDRAAGTRVIAVSATDGSASWFDPVAELLWSPPAPAPLPLVRVPPERQAAGPPSADVPAPPFGQQTRWSPIAGEEPTRVVAREHVSTAAAVTAGSPGAEEPTVVVARQHVSAAGQLTSPRSSPYAGPGPTDGVAEQQAARSASPPDGLEYPIVSGELTSVVARRDIRGEHPDRPASATLQWDSGATVVAGGVVLIGRDPVPAAGERVDRRLAVGKESVGVSKTHLMLTITAGGITVTDRRSTNGVRIERADGSFVQCAPGVPTAVREGDRVRFGGRSILVAPPS